VCSLISAASRVTRSGAEPAGLRDQFLLDPGVVYLNHGAYGACPRPVFVEYQRWQRELEQQPVELLERRYEELIGDARAALAAFVGARPDDLVFVPNATTAVNTVGRSLGLSPDDEVLTTEHEYGAVDLTWEETGARVVRAPLESIWDGLSGRTRVLAISHVTSPTGIVVPVEELCERARAAGILSVVDGAHAVGQVPLELGSLGADFYAGNCHKWLCAPKGAGFLWVREELQDRTDPLVVSWGWREDDFAKRHGWQGTSDPAAWLAVPAAIEFQRANGWDAVRGRCHELLVGFLEASGLEPVGRPFVQMVAAYLPPCDPADLQRSLLGEYAIEVPCFEWNARPLIRVSVQGYNEPADVDRLVSALEQL
jgi:isopenicillin-N epimerase